MTTYLEFPEYNCRDEQVRQTVQVDLDHLPEKFEGNWLQHVRTFTSKWIEEKGFDKSATIWMWGTASADFNHPTPSWAEFLVQFGLPSKFLSELYTHLSHLFGGNCRQGYIQFQKDEGWQPVCHIEQNAAWQDAGGECWTKLNASQGESEMLIKRVEPTEIQNASSDDDDANDPAAVSALKPRAMRIIRSFFKINQSLTREELSLELAKAASVTKLDETAQTECNNILMTAVRRGVLKNTGNNVYSLQYASIDELTYEFLCSQFYASLAGSTWHTREDAIKRFLALDGIGKNRQHDHCHVKISDPTHDSQWPDRNKWQPNSKVLAS